MTSELSRTYRVAVVTVWEVEAGNFRDAANVAEGAAKHVVLEAHTREVAGDSSAMPVVSWVNRGRLYEATLARWPAEVNHSLASGTLHVGVEGDVEET